MCKIYNRSYSLWYIFLVGLINYMIDRKLQNFSFLGSELLVRIYTFCWEVVGSKQLYQQQNMWVPQKIFNCFFSFLGVRTCGMCVLSKYVKPCGVQAKWGTKRHPKLDGGGVPSILPLQIWNLRVQLVKGISLEDLRRFAPPFPPPSNSTLLRSTNL